MLNAVWSKSDGSRLPRPPRETSAPFFARIALSIVVMWVQAKMLPARLACRLLSLFVPIWSDGRRRRSAQVPYASFSGGERETNEG